jgi:hypothetical protein
MFKPRNENENSCEINNDNGDRAVNFALSKSLIVRSTIFPHCNICKSTWTSPDGKPHNQIDHILVIFGSFRAADCDTDHYLVVAKLG